MGAEGVEQGHCQDSVAEHHEILTMTSSLACNITLLLQEKKKKCFGQPGETKSLEEKVKIFES